MITTIDGRDAIEAARANDLPLLVRGEPVTPDAAAEALDAGALRPEDVTCRLPPGIVPNASPEASGPSVPVGSSPAGRGGGMPVQREYGRTPDGQRWERTTTEAYPPGHAHRDTFRKAPG